MAILGPVIGYFAIYFLIMGFPHKHSFIDSPSSKTKNKQKEPQQDKELSRPSAVVSAPLPERNLIAPGWYKARISNATYHHPGENDEYIDVIFTVFNRDGSSAGYFHDFLSMKPDAPQYKVMRLLSVLKGKLSYYPQFEMDLSKFANALIGKEVMACVGYNSAKTYNRIDINNDGFYRIEDADRIFQTIDSWKNR